MHPQLGLPALVGDEAAERHVERLRVPVVGVRAAADGVAALAPPGPGRSGPLAPVLPASPRAIERASSRPVASCCSSGSAGPAGGSPPARHSTRVTSPSATSKRRPRSPSGMSSGTAAVTSTCSAPATSSASWAPATGVELGEDVVEDQHRVVAGRAQQLVGRQPQRQREGPRLPVAGVALDRQLAQRAEQVVAVRAHQRDPAVELVGPAALDLGQHRLVQVAAGCAGPQPPKSRLSRVEAGLVGHASRRRGSHPAPPPRRPCPAAG